MVADVSFIPDLKPRPYTSVTAFPLDRIAPNTEFPQIELRFLIEVNCISKGHFQDIFQDLFEANGEFVFIAP